MRVHGPGSSQGPSWLVAIVLFVALLVALQLFRGGGAGRLEEQFAARPAPAGAGGIALPPLPDGVAGLARTAIARIGAGGVAQALTPVAQGSRLKVEITGIEQADAGLRIRGVATNIGQEPLALSLGAFRFTDGAGTVYAPSGDAATTLTPGQRVPLDLTLPVEDRRQLLLDVQLEGDTPLHLVLLQAPE